MSDSEKRGKAERLPVGTQANMPSLTRRQLLAGSGQVALLAAVLPMACAPVINAPWADGTFWADGQGWTD